MPVASSIMSADPAAEKAYLEWVIAAIEIIAQSRLHGPNPNGPIPNLFGIGMPEVFGARKRISQIRPLFLAHPGNASLQLEMRSDNAVIEKWIFSFDKDVVPTARSERKDQSVSKRLSIALRTLLSVTRLYRLDPTQQVTVDLVDTIPTDPSTMTPVSDSRSFSSGGSSTGTLVEVASISSSFGLLCLTYWGTQNADRRMSRTDSFEFISTPPRSASSFSPVIQESFMRTQNQRGEDILVIEMKQEEMGSVSVLDAPPYEVQRQITERVEDVSAEAWVSPVPVLNGQEINTKYPREFFEEPIPLVKVMSEFDRLVRRQQEWKRKG